MGDEYESSPALICMQSLSLVLVLEPEIGEAPPCTDQSLEFHFAVELGGGD